MWKCENVKYENVRDNLIKYNCPSCNKDYLNTIYKEPKKRFKNTFKFSNNDISNFILLVRKGAIWMNGKSLMKHHCLKKNFIAN